VETGPRSTDFVALGQPGDRYAGLETFANPGVSHVEMTSDELTAVCPVTGQLDLYVAYERVLAGRPLHRVEACGQRKRDPAANTQVRAHNGLLVADARTPHSSLRTLRENGTTSDDR